MQKCLFPWKIHFNIFIYFVFGCPGLYCSAWGYSSCGQRETPLPCSACGSLAAVASPVLELQASSCGAAWLVAPQQVKSSQTRDQNCVPGTGTQILIQAPPGQSLKDIFESAVSAKLSLRVSINLKYCKIAWHMLKCGLMF